MVYPWAPKNKLAKIADGMKSLFATSSDSVELVVFNNCLVDLLMIAPLLNKIHSPMWLFMSGYIA